MLPPPLLWSALELADFAQSTENSQAQAPAVPAARPAAGMRAMSPFSRAAKAAFGVAPGSASRAGALPRPVPRRPVTDDDLIPHEEITGRVSRIICPRRADSGFMVFALRMAGGKETSVKVNTTQDLRVDEEVIAQGEWSNWKGRQQFKAEAVRLCMPRNARGVGKWLMATIKGVGPRSVERLIAAYGDDLPAKMRDPGALCLAGFKPHLAEEASRRWCANGGMGELEAKLRSLGLKPKQIVKVVEQYGASADKVVSTNPWELVDIEGIGFPTTDAIAAQYGLDMTSPMRMQKGLAWVMTETMSRKGHCGLTLAQLSMAATRRLDVDERTVERAMPDFLDGVTFVQDRLTGLVFPIELLDAEETAATHLAALMARSQGARTRAQAEEAILRAEQELGVALDRDGGQFEAAVMALSEAVCIITGGPGTGKSTTQAVIVKAHSYFGRKPARVQLAAPTGRAAKRLADTSGQDARTIHRLLAFSPIEGGFTFNEENPLQIDVAIVDEFSMVDIKLFAALAEALPANACLALVGDADQLPSVGPGQVLRDLIESKLIPTVRLTRVHRQAAGSGIAIAAQRINAGLPPIDLDVRMRGFSIKHKPDNALLAEIIRLVRFELPEQGFDPMRDVQVLASLRDGEVGVDALNIALKAALNPALDDERTVTFFKRRITVGDRVMQLRNDYGKGVYNGEVGAVTAVGQEFDGNVTRPWATVDFSGVEARYTPEDIEQIDLAYAATVHKIQGCEAPMVVFAAPQSHRSMLSRNLLYTGTTRARIECRIIGDLATINAAPGKADAGSRNTGLCLRLAQALREEGIDIASGNAHLQLQLVAALRGEIVDVGQIAQAA